VTRRARLAGLVALTWLSASVLARAELGEDVARLEHAWADKGLVRRLPPRLAERSAPSVAFLPAELLSGPPSTCLTVAVLGPSSTHFTLRTAGASYLPESVEDWPQASLAGMVQITRCGGRKSRLAALLIEMRSPRAVLEIVAVRSAEPVQPATEVLPQRDPGPIAPLTGFGPAPSPAPIADRLSAAAARSRREGGAEVARDAIESSPRGTGSHRLLLDVGCYRIDVLAEPGPVAASESALMSDLSLMPELLATAAPISVERGDGLGAALNFCQGERGQVGLRFAGAPPSSKVWFLASRFALPDGLPESWGSGGRARMAALLREHGARVSGSPIDQALGIQGPTLMPISVEPGACYVAALTPVQGQAFALALGAVSAGVEAQNHRVQGSDGTLLSFCVKAAESAAIEVDTRGNNLTWLFALWQTGRVELGAERFR
jgi:hypothetical protein